MDLNFGGNWLAVGCGQGTDSQLLVWEWQSESYILRQQSHTQSIQVACYSPDGLLIATGAEDGKVLFHPITHHCFFIAKQKSSGKNMELFHLILCGDFC